MTEGAAAKPRLFADGGLALVRAMLLTLIVLMQLLTSVSIAVELLIYVAFMVLPTLWPRITRAMRTSACSSTRQASRFL